MKKVPLNITSLLHKVTIIPFVFLSLCYYSCTSLNDVATLQYPIVDSQDPIIGKWKCVGMSVPRRPPIMYSDSIVNYVLEFKPNNVLTVQCMLQNNKCSPWQNGDYVYQFLDYGDSWYDKTLGIGNSFWWYRISDTELMIGQGPADGPDYYFERM